MAAPKTLADVEVGMRFRDATGELVVFEIYDDMDWVDAIDTDGNLLPYGNFQQLLDEGVLDWEVM